MEEFIEIVLRRLISFDIPFSIYILGRKQRKFGSLYVLCAFTRDFLSPKIRKAARKYGFNFFLVGSATNGVSVQHMPGFEDLFRGKMALENDEMNIPDQSVAGFSFKI
ncbi:MAG: hypothetical protein AAF197_06095 [Pseudomonadota bacterium]